MSSFATRTASAIIEEALLHLRPYQQYVLDAGFLLQWPHSHPRQLHTTQLRGPPSGNFLYGVGKRIIKVEDPGELYEAWAKEYGPVYVVPSTLEEKKIALCDPKAVAHLFSKDTWTCIHTPLTRSSIENTFGEGLLWSNGEDHRKRRKSLVPAFSIAATQQLTCISYDCAYKVKWAWDALIELSGEPDGGTLIEVQNWMNHVSLDTIGLAGFSHSFGALEGEHASVIEVFDTFSAPPNPSAILKEELVRKLDVAMEEISSELLARTRKELEMGVVGGKEERSIIGLLIKGVDGDSELRLTKDEVMAQMKMLLLAGYETTSVSLTWALLELSRNQDVQAKLRNELLEYGVDPTYDQLADGLPFLDAVVHETLRVHPPIVGSTRIATEDDVIPLSEPVRTKSGELVDSLTVAKGTQITVPIQAMNCSAALWGDDAKVFRPSRWLEDAHGEDGIPCKAKEIQGRRYLLTFADGPRIYPGENFAVVELKAVLTVLIKNFVFELRDGADSKIEIGKGVPPRPKLAGEVGCKLPLRIRPYVG